MAKLAKVGVRVKDGGLGILGPDAAGRVAAVGCAGAGVTPKQVLTFSDPEAADSALQRGPLRDTVTTVLSLAGTTCFAYPLPPAAGTGAAVIKKTASGPTAGTQTPTIKNTTLARDAMTIVVRITAGGARNAAKFRVSIDGAPEGAEQMVPAAPGEYEIPGAGVVLVFPEDGGTASDSYGAGDRFTVTSAYPAPTNADVTAAVKALMQDPQLDFEGIVIAGPTTAQVWAGIIAALQSLRADAEGGVPRWVWVACQAKEVSGATAAWVAQQKGDDRGSSVSPRLLVSGGWVRAADAVTGRQDIRPLVDQIVGRTAALEPWAPPDWVDLGQLPAATDIHPADLSLGQIAELQAAGYAMPRRYFGLRGVYLARGQMLVEDASDFQTIERRRVMDYACRRVYAAQLRHLNSAAQVDADGQPLGIELFRAESEAPLREMEEARWISSWSMEVLRGNILSDETLRTRIRIVPLGKVSQIETVLSYRNPLLDRQAVTGQTAREG